MHQFLAHRLRHIVGEDNLPGIPLAKKWRIRLMTAGAVLTGIGLAVPWFVIRWEPPGGALIVSGVTHPASWRLYDMFNLRNINLSNNWITLTPVNPVLKPGLFAVESAAAVSLITAFLTVLSDSALLARLKLKHPVTLTAAIAAGLVNATAIYAFIRLLSWETSTRMETQLQNATYRTFDGGKFGSAIASFIHTQRSIGLYLTAAGLAMSAAGLYTINAEPQHLLVRAAKRADLLIGHGIDLVGKIAKVAGVLVIIAAVLFIVIGTVPIHV